MGFDFDWLYKRNTDECFLGSLASFQGRQPPNLCYLDAINYQRVLFLHKCFM